MKYSLMSLMVDEELRHEKPSLFQKAMLNGLGEVCPEDIGEVYTLLRKHGIPMSNGTASFGDLVRFTRENGFDGLDLMSFQMEREGKELRAILEKYDVVLSAVNIITPFSEANCEAVFQEMLRNAKAEIDRAVRPARRRSCWCPAVIARARA